MKKEYLALFDLDGTLFDTSEVNYFAYKDALEPFGIKLQKSFFVEECIHTTSRRTASRYKKPAPACFAPYTKGCANKGAGALYEQLDRYDLRMTSVTTSATKSTFSGFTLYGRSASLCEQAKLDPSMPAMVSERRLMLMAAYASVVS